MKFSLVNPGLIQNLTIDNVVMKAITQRKTNVLPLCVPFINKSVFTDGSITNKMKMDEYKVTDNIFRVVRKRFDSEMYKYQIFSNCHCMSLTTTTHILN